MGNQTDAQKAAEAEYRRSYPVPAGETADEKTAREEAEQTEKEVVS